MPQSRTPKGDALTSTVCGYAAAYSAKPRQTARAGHRYKGRNARDCSCERDALGRHTAGLVLAQVREWHLQTAKLEVADLGEQAERLDAAAVSELSHVVGTVCNWRGIDLHDPDRLQDGGAGRRRRLAQVAGSDRCGHGW